MLGGRNQHEIIEDAIDDIYKNLSVKIDKTNSDRIHAMEASSCTRLHTMSAKTRYLQIMQLRSQACLEMVCAIH
jgi:hypothetical protein